MPTYFAPTYAAFVVKGPYSPLWCTVVRGLCFQNGVGGRHGTGIISGPPVAGGVI
jgi:hypothetical protein